MSETESSVIAAVTTLAEVQSRIAELREQEHLLKGYVRSSLPVGTTTIGNLKVHIAARRAFDKDYAARVIPPEYFPLVTVTETVIDPDAARRKLPPDIYDQCLRSTEHAVRLS